MSKSDGEERLTIQLLHRAKPNEHTHAEQGIKSPTTITEERAAKMVLLDPCAQELHQTACQKWIVC